MMTYRTNCEGVLKIHGIQRGFGQEDSSEITTPARYMIKDGKRYLFYREYGEGGSCQRVRLTIDSKEREVILKKTGMGDSVLHFLRGSRKPCHYQSPVGAMELVSHTSQIRVHETDHFLHLKMEYSLYMHESIMSDYELDIRFEKKR